MYAPLPWIGLHSSGRSLVKADPGWCLSRVANFEGFASQDPAHGSWARGISGFHSRWVPLVCTANISGMVFAAERVHEEASALQDACREFVLEHLDELEGTPAYNRLLDDKDFMSRMLKEFRAERQSKRRRTA